MIKRKYQSDYGQVLSWRQWDQSRRYTSAAKKASLRPTRIVIPMLQPQDRIELPLDTVLERSRDSFDGLLGQGPTAIAIPEKLRAKGDTPSLVNAPVRR